MILGTRSERRQSRTSRGRAARTLAPGRGAERLTAPSGALLDGAERARGGGGARAAADIRSPGSGVSKGARASGGTRRGRDEPNWCLFSLQIKKWSVCLVSFVVWKRAEKGWRRRSQSTRGWRAGPRSTARWGRIREKSSWRRCVVGCRWSYSSRASAVSAWWGRGDQTTAPGPC